MPGVAAAGKPSLEQLVGNSQIPEDASHRMRTRRRIARPLLDRLHSQGMALGFSLEVLLAGAALLVARLYLGTESLVIDCASGPDCRVRIAEVEIAPSFTIARVLARLSACLLEGEVCSDSGRQNRSLTIAVRHRESYVSPQISDLSEVLFQFQPAYDGDWTVTTASRGASERLAGPAAESYLLALHHLVDGIDDRLEFCNILPRDLEAELLAWGSGSQRLFDFSNLVAAFPELAKRPATKIAAIGDERALIYQDLDRPSDARGAALTHQGAISGDLVATILAAQRSDGDAIPIGKPITNVQAYVMRDARQLAPPGVCGEIYISGVNVGKGYPDSSSVQENYLPDPFVSGKTMYRVGRYGRWQNGVLHFMGRTDSQIKVRGHRVELSEVEASLALCAGVTEAAVVALPDKLGEKTLVAFCTKSEQVTPVDVHKHVTERLPPHMRPAAIHFLKGLPLNKNGKVNRAFLTELAHQDRLQAIAMADFTPIQEQLRKIWRRVLPRQPVTPQENFFDLGGHSLGAVRIAAAASRTFGFLITVTPILAYPTIEEFCGWLERERQKPKGAAKQPAYAASSP